MPKRNARKVPKQGPPPTGCAIVILEQPVDEAQRRRRRALPPGAPDAVAMLRKMRGYED